MYLCKTCGLVDAAEGSVQTDTDDLKNELGQLGPGHLGMDPFSHRNYSTPFLGDMPSMAPITSTCCAYFDSNLVKETGCVVFDRTLLNGNFEVKFVSR